MNRFLILVCLLVPATALAQECPHPAIVCQPVVDLNCDGLDELHCGVYDLDGSSFGDCQPDGNPDDFLQLFDGDFDGTADPCNGFDFVAEVSDGLSDGRSAHPLCDRLLEEAPQARGIDFDLDGNLLVAAEGDIDLVRGSVDQISSDGVSSDLGMVVCLADDVPSTGFLTVEDSPPPGETYFYVVRWKNRPFAPNTPFPYGWGDCRQRTVALSGGDCVLP